MNTPKTVLDLKLLPLAVPVLTAGRLLGVGKTVTYELIKRGKLKTVYIGRRNMVRVSSLRELIDDPA